jgi:hypothetical protein
MKVVKAATLDNHDKRRFAELAKNVDADAARDADYSAAVFNMGFVRKSWRAAYADRNRRRRRK